MSQRMADLRARLDSRSAQVPQDDGGLGTNVEEVVEEREDAGPAGKSPEGKRMYRVNKVEDVDGVCCGLVGTAGAFCTRSGCRVGSHERKKAEIETGMIYITRSPGVSFVMPCLNSALLRTDEEEEMMVEARSLDEWKRRFQAFSVMEPADSVNDVKLTIDHLREAKTPRRIRGHGLTEVLLASDKLKDAPVSKFEELLAQAAVSPSCGVFVETEDERFTRLVDVLKSELKELWSFQTQVLGFVRRLGPQLETDFAEIGRVAQEAQIQAQALEVELGGTPDNLPDWAAFPSVWGVTSALVDQAQTFMTGNIPGMSKFAEDLRTAHESVTRVAKEVEGVSDDAAAVFEGLADETQELAVRLKRMEDNGGGTTSDEAFGSIPELFARVVALEKGSERAQVSVGRFNFEDEADLLHFMNANEITSAGAFPDIYMAMAERVSYKSGQHNMKKVADMKKGCMTGVKDLADAIAVDSFSHLLPSYLQPTTSTPNFDKTCLSSMTSIKEWQRPETGIKATMKRDVLSFQASYHKRAKKFKGGSVAHQLAELCIFHTASFWNCLIDWIDETYNEYVLHKFSVIDAWLLVTQIMRRIFLEMKEHREGVTGSFGGEGATLAMIWAILKTLTVMNKYTRAQIKHHPSVASEMITFLVTHPRKDGDDVSGKLEELEDLIKEVKQKATSATTKSDTCSNKMTNVNDEMKAVKTRLKKLEEKQAQA